MAGFGFGALSRSRLTMSPPGDSGGLLMATIAPGSGWTGTAGSGYVALPTDPARTTAKPACRLLEPPNQYFTDELVIGVAAMANDGGTLLDNYGLEKVVVHCEGSITEIFAPSFHTFLDVNGNTVTYPGWWVRLQKPAGMTGHALIYFEAVPRNAAMQRRVIGPFQYSPQNQLYDAEIEVAPSQSVITNQRYKTYNDAVLAAKQLGRNNIRILFTEPGFYQVDEHWLNAWTINGYCTLEATVPITIGKPAYTNDTNAVQHVARIPWRVKGQNITIDYRNITELIGGARIWFDGCHMTMSGDGQAELRRGLPPFPNLWANRGSPWYTEVTATNLHHAFTLASLARGVKGIDLVGDIFTDARCVIGCRVESHSNQFWNTDHPMFEVEYTGPEATATLARSGGVLGFGTQPTFTATWGGNSATFITGTQEAYFLGTSGNGYWPQQVVDWLNTLPGWNATLSPGGNRFAAAAASLLGTKGQGFGGGGNTNLPVSVKDANVQVYAMFDGHGDFFQQTTNTFNENCIVANNIGLNMELQCIFASPSFGASTNDFMIVNNIMHTREDLFPYYNPAVFQSQFGRANNIQRHVVVAHNTFVNQAILIRKAQANCDFDGYCLFANNSAPGLSFESNIVDVDITIRGNHLHAGGVAPATATGTVVGGTLATLFPARASGDYSPGGTLLSGTSTPALRHDINGNVRGHAAPAGALS